MALLTGWPTDQADGSVSSEARWRAMARQWLGSGVLAGQYGEFAPSFAAGVITTQPGAVWIDGHYAEITGAAVGTPATANGILVVRYTPADGKFELLYRDGVSVPTQTTATWELLIAQMVAGAMVDRRQFVGANLGLRPLADLQVGATPAASLDFQNIPAVAKHLLILAQLRTNDAGTWARTTVRLNNDATGNYSGAQFDSTNSTPIVAGAFTGNTGISTPPVTGGGGTAGRATPLLIFLPSYAQADMGTLGHVLATLAGGAHVLNTAWSANICWGQWASGAAINRVTITPGAGAYIQGSRATIYGLG